MFPMPIFRNALIGALLAACTGAPSLAADDPGTAFFAKHRAYVGWQDGDYPGLELTGKIEQKNAKGAVTKRFDVHEFRRGMVYRNTSLADDGTGSDSGFTGKIAWSADDNGFTLPIYGEAASDRLARTGMFAESLSQLTVKAVRKGTVDGVPCDVARITLPNQTAVDVFEDAATGAFKRLVVDPDGRHFEVDVDAYEDFLPGKRFVSAWHYGSNRLWTYGYSAAKAVAIEDAQLHPPSPSAKWSFGTGAIPVADGPSHDRFLINATINGTRGRFIFDTGADSITVTGPFAARAHLKHLATGAAVTFYGTERATSDLADRIEFDDGSVLSNVVVSTSKVPGAYEEGIDGLMGSPMLAGTIATMDLDSHQLTLDDPATHVVSEGAGALAALVDLSDGRPVLPVRLNGNVPTNALLDSGSPDFVIVDQALRPKAPMLVDPSNIVVQLGYQAQACGHIASIQVGPIDYQNPSTCFSENADKVFDGVLIGYDFLKNFNITFDYPAGKIIFQKRAQ